MIIIQIIIGILIITIIGIAHAMINLIRDLHDYWKWEIQLAHEKIIRLNAVKESKYSNGKN